MYLVDWSPVTGQALLPSLFLLLMAVQEDDPLRLPKGLADEQWSAYIGGTSDARCCLLHA